jgi:hypothetical protein
VSSTGQATKLRAALEYAALGWPVVPGAIWHEGRFADPVDRNPVCDPCLRPIEEATTDTALVSEWWSGPCSRQPNVLTVTGPAIGAFMLTEAMVMALADHPLFAARPTPVLAFANLPLAYFLVRPPLPSVLLSGEARVLDAGMPMPLPPSDLDATAALWLITPEQAGNDVWPGDDLADLIENVGRKCA